MYVEQGYYKPSEGFVETTVQGDKKPPQLVFYFGPRLLLEKTDFLPAFRERYPHASFVGCSDGGSILGRDILEESIAFSAIYFSSTSFLVIDKNFMDLDDSYKTGQALGEQLNKPGLSGVFILSDGLYVNGSALARGFASVLGHSVPISGGLAGDDDRFEKTLVGYNDSLAERKVVAIGFYGENFSMGYGSYGGWNIFGPERIITKSKGNVLYELDGHPALDLYKSYLGEEAKNLPSSALLFPLSIRPVDAPALSLVRTILSVDEGDQSMTFAGDVPEGYLAQLMHGSISTLIEGAGNAAHQTLSKSSQSTVGLSLLISCVGRKFMMGQRTSYEVDEVADVLPFPQIGFYSYGELSPHSSTGECELHNQTMTIATFFEKECA